MGNISVIGRLLSGNCQLFGSENYYLISFAFKKDGKGERHGSAAERLLAAQNPLSTSDRPHTMFADSPHLNNPMMNPMMQMQAGAPMVIPQQPAGGSVPPWMMNQRMPTRAPAPMAPQGNFLFQSQVFEKKMETMFSRILVSS